MMELAGLCSGECRPPLSPLQEENYAQIKELVLSSSLIPGAVYE